MMTTAQPRPRHSTERRRQSGEPTGQSPPPAPWTLSAAGLPRLAHCTTSGAIWWSLASTCKSAFLTRTTRARAHRSFGTTAATSTATQSWGYAGSGPADLALNVLAAYCPFSAGGKTVKLWDGHLVSDWAERYHHAFNRDFLESLPEEGGVITEAEIRSWLREQDALAVPGVA